MKARILIGAASSGSGKTTFTLGLLRALKKRGLSVQPYKCGPDYIDTQYHKAACGTGSVNLDTFMGGQAHVKELFAKYGASSQVDVIEGGMGLFDGYSRMEGSSARIAQLLDVPVLLVVNAKSCAYSVAPVIYGYKNFYKGIKIAGVVFNMVGSEHHFNILKDACADLVVPVLGYIPKNRDIEISSRHLGLSLDSEFLVEGFIEGVASVVEKNVDIDALLKIFTPDSGFLCEDSRTEYRNSGGNSSEPDGGKATANLKIAVAKDEAFNFIYRENLNSLMMLGEVKFFSPLKDVQLPQCDLLYLPGGYPELYLEQLQGNCAMRSEIKQYIENGGRCWAECGGMMYLCNSICDETGKEYQMCGALGQKATMVGKRLQMGYRQFHYAGKDLRGHEFHYSKVESTLESVAQQYNATGKEVATPLYRYKNLIAGYTHLYFGNMNLLELF